MTEILCLGRLRCLQFTAPSQAKYTAAYEPENKVTAGKLHIGFKAIDNEPQHQKRHVKNEHEALFELPCNMGQV